LISGFDVETRNAQRASGRWQLVRPPVVLGSRFAAEVHP
jgi:hypothetical protein